jgi:hypothetical protein
MPPPLPVFSELRERVSSSGNRCLGHCQTYEELLTAGSRVILSGGCLHSEPLPWITAATQSNIRNEKALFWSVTPCGSYKNRCFGRAHRLVLRSVFQCVILLRLFSSPTLVTLIMEAILPFETLVLKRATRHRILHAWRKPVPVPLCSPQFPHDFNWVSARAATVASRRLTTLATAQTQEALTYIYL